jgi:ABC-2 type transport system ATP-binding protein
VCGYSIYNNAKEIRRVMGYMPDFFGVYDDMKVIEYLEFFAATYRIDGPARRKKCDEVLELVDLGYKRDALVTSLSRGMTQRLGLARVLLHDPQVLLLDEPASGLDPRARIEMRGLLKELRKMGKTILVSSHILPELADICNKIGIIERGQLLFDGDVQTAIKKVRQRTVYLIAVGNGQNHIAREHLEANLDVLSVEDRPEEEALRVTLNDGVTDASFLVDVLLRQGLKLKTFKEEEINLEDVFLAITKGITN